MIGLKKIKKSKPAFKASSPSEIKKSWELLIDFTKIKKDGVSLKQILINLG